MSIILAKLETQAPTEATFHRIARFCSSYAILIGSLGLLGWALNITAFQQILPGLATMKFNTALCFLVLGVALMLMIGTRWTARQRWIITTLILFALLVAGVSVLEYLAGRSFGIDELIFADLATPANAYPGRMSLGTALSFVLLSVSYLMLLHWKNIRLSQILSTLVIFLSLIALVGYFYGVESLYNTLLFSSIALHTATGFFALGVGLLHATPGQGYMTIALDPGPGGRLLRWLLPPIVAVPLLLGWIISGLNQAGTFDSIFAYNILVLSLIVFFSAIILWRASVIQRVDGMRRQAESSLVRRNQEYRTLSACNQILVRAENEADLLDQICHAITEVGGYIGSWFGQARPELAIVPVSMSVIRSLHTGKPRQYTRLDPACVTEVTHQTLRTQQAQIVTDFSSKLAECTEEALEMGYASVLALPVRIDETLFGVLHIYSSDRKGFDANELDLLEEMADDLGFGIRVIRTRAARETAEAQVRYQAHLLENVSDAVIAMDMDFNILSWNKAAETIYGWTEAEVVGHKADPLLWTQLVGGSVERLLNDLRTKGIWRGEVTQYHRDGTEMHVLSSFSFVTGKDAQVVGIVAVNRDISEYFEMQVRLHEAEKERIAFEKEREMIALREEFIATISHDFRTPLAVIMSSDDILRRYEERLDANQRLKHLVQIYDQASYMVALLNDVLSLSKSRAGKIQFEPNSYQR